MTVTIGSGMYVVTPGSCLQNASRIEVATITSPWFPEHNEIAKDNAVGSAELKWLHRQGLRNRLGNDSPSVGIQPVSTPNCGRDIVITRENTLTTVVYK